MKELLLYILRLRSFLLFLFLELICLFLIFRYNQTQHQIFINNRNAVTGFFHERTNVIRSFFQLRAENENIAAKNAQLLQQIYKSSVGGALVEGEVLADSQYIFRAARVISNSTLRSRNTFLLNAGSNQGIRPKMAVIDVNGVLGVVHGVSKNYAGVTSILNIDSHISAKVKGLDIPGYIQWEPGDHRYVQLREIPKHYLSIAEGDTVVTSGYSIIFPPELPIGRIQEISTETGSNYQKIKVELFADLARIKLAYIIENVDQEEIMELQIDE